ncbi:hypothetical protein ACQR1W_23135 [Bradyrhizobium sp. HKCCYLS1011]|uniref:hypothetical protein n=1 Tax=Bradyrhizobium sp. HKCCYLS1011 TaxID=3420733 RepID=UPI003EB9204D
MTLALKIIDQTPGAHAPVTRHLRVASERITLRELITRRIEDEVAVLNAAGDAPLTPLIMPTDWERRLNDKPPKPRTVDAARQLAAALEAFQRTRILVVVDRRQVMDLDEPLTVTPESEVRFIKLVPLVGG